MSAYVVAMTGGIAAGKSAAEACFRALGAGVHDADAAAREAVAPGSAGLAEVRQAFGDQALAADGALDRAAMRRRVFEDPDARRTLEAIIHPRVRQQLRQAVQDDPGVYCLLSIPLLVENRASYAWVDRVLVVDVPVQAQLQRLMQRDGIDETLARRMLASQSSRKARLAIADDVLDNGGELDALRPQVERLHRHYLRQAGGSPAGDT